MKENKNGFAATLSLIIVFVLSAIYLFVPLMGGFNWLAWLLAILNLVAGPAVLIAYIMEVRKGVFREDDEETESEA